MIDLVQKLPNWTIAELHAARRNAHSKLDDPTRGARANDMLRAIEAELERRALPGMIARFNEVYPGGFRGERMAEEERDYKVAASRSCQEMFHRSTFQDMIDRADWDGLVSRFKLVVNATNFIQPTFEKPKFIETIRSPDNTERYFRALHDHLWGESDVLARFDRYCRTLEKLDLMKWTYATYFCFLADPENCMFVKPDMLKKCIDIANHWLVYEPAPSGRMYGQILQFSRWLKDRIAVLAPRDMIDVHSFMWHMAPTGKWADD